MCISGTPGAQPHSTVCKKKVNKCLCYFQKKILLRFNGTHRGGWINILLSKATKA
jgi:hypothetical protein